MYIIRGTSGRYRGKEFLLESGSTIVLGRDSAVSQLILEEQGVSGKHASLKIVGQEIVLTDLNSRNGTFLSSGVRLMPMEAYSLKAGEEFYVADKGNSFIVVECNNGQKVKGEDINTKSNVSIGFSISSMICGVLAIILCIAYITTGFNFIFAALMGILGVTLGVAAIIGKAKGRPITIVGVVLGTVTLLTILGIRMVKKKFLPLP